MGNEELESTLSDRNDLLLLDEVKGTCYFPNERDSICGQKFAMDQISSHIKVSISLVFGLF